MEPENRAGHKGTFWQGRTKRLTEHWSGKQSERGTVHWWDLTKWTKWKIKTKKIWQESIIKVLAETPLCHGRTSEPYQACLNWPWDPCQTEEAIRCSPQCCWRPANQWHLTTPEYKGLQVSTLVGITWGCLKLEQRWKHYFSWMKDLRM